MTPADIISTALQARCERERGERTKKSWMLREAVELEEEPETFKNWYYGDNAPPTPAIYKLITRYGAGFRDEIFPCDDEQLTPERALEVVRAFIAEQRTGGLREVK